MKPVRLLYNYTEQIATLWGIFQRFRFHPVYLWFIMGAISSLLYNRMLCVRVGVKWREWTDRPRNYASFGVYIYIHSSENLRRVSEISVIFFIRLPCLTLATIERHSRKSLCAIRAHSCPIILWVRSQRKIERNLVAFQLKL